MTELDEVLPDEAQSLIDEFGKLIKFSWSSEGAYDPTTSSKRTFTTTVDVRALVEDPKGQTFNGNLVLGGDKLAYIAAMALSVVPIPGNKFVVDGRTYTVALGGGVKTIYSGDLAALYVLQGQVT